MDMLVYKTEIFVNRNELDKYLNGIVEAFKIEGYGITTTGMIIITISIWQRNKKDEV